MGTHNTEESITDGLFVTPDTEPSLPESKYVHYDRTANIQPQSGHPEITSFSIKLVGQHPLWGHYLWNAGIALAKHIDQFPCIVKDKWVIEFGAGAALPSFITALNGATKVAGLNEPFSEDTHHALTLFYRL